MTEPKLKPIAPADVEARTLPTGEIVAWDKANARQLASGFEDAEDFEDWKKGYFRL